MPKVLKDTKQAIQSRERVRLFRGIKAIMTHDDVSNVVNVRKFKQKLKNSEEKSPRECIASSTNRLSNLSNDLRTWAIKTNITKRTLTSLLKILHNFGIKSLPKDSRTLLETPRNVQIVEQAGGKYWHNGLENCLVEVFSKLTSNLCVELNFNIDGLPLFKSSPLVFWPILVNVHGNYMELKFMS